MILLMLDFDGTLVPIAEEPTKVFLDAEGKRLLRRIAQNDQANLAIISGRSLRDVKKRVSVEGIVYAGCQGLEMEGPGWSWVHPGASRLKPAIKKTASELSRELADIPGILVENKDWSVAVHFRRAELEAERLARKSVFRFYKANRRYLKMLKCRKALELLPNVPWDKGMAVRKLLKEKGQDCFPIYIGDDRTDESAFRAIRGKGLGVKVKNLEFQGRTAAAICLGSSKMVLPFIKSLLVSI